MKSPLLESPRSLPRGDRGQRDRVETFFFGEEECRGVPGEEPRDEGDGVLNADLLDEREGVGDPAKSSQDKS